jgi:hypothetical protein
VDCERVTLIRTGPPEAVPPPAVDDCFYKAYAIGVGNIAAEDFNPFDNDDMVECYEIGRSLRSEYPVLRSDKGYGPAATAGERV